MGMTATERLRALLDERGVEWEDMSIRPYACTSWRDPDGEPCTALEGADDMKAGASIKVKFPRRQAMLSVMEPHYKGNGIIESEEVARVPVFVWPMPTSEGLFVVEHQDGTVQRVQPDSLTFLGSKELFDQYDWSTDEA